MEHAKGGRTPLCSAAVCGCASPTQRTQHTTHNTTTHMDQGCVGRDGVSRQAPQRARMCGGAAGHPHVRAAYRHTLPAAATTPQRRAVDLLWRQSHMANMKTTHCTMHHLQWEHALCSCKNTIGGNVITHKGHTSTAHLTCSRASPHAPIHMDGVWVWGCVSDP